MARRYVKRSGRKRYYRKKTSGSLKKRNIFTRKSATSQAKQIYALNKKVNYLKKNVTPQIDVINQPLIMRSSTDGGHVAKSYNGNISLFRDNVLNANAANTTQYLNFTGDKLRIKSIDLYGYFGFFDDNKVVAPWAEIGGDVTNLRFGNFDPSSSCYLRIIVCKVMKSTRYLPGKITPEVFPVFVGQARNDLTPIFGPLSKGVTSTLKILRQKIIKIDSTKMSGRAFKIRIPGYTYRKGITTGTDANVDQDGAIVIYYQYCTTNIIRYVSDQTEHVLGPNTFFNMNYKIVYYDTEHVQLVEKN